MQPGTRVRVVGDPEFLLMGYEGEVIENPAEIGYIRVRFGEDARHLFSTVSERSNPEYDVPAGQLEIVS